MGSQKSKSKFVVCVSNRGYKASLVVRRIYRMLPDAEAESHGLVRVVDESGEDYIFPQNLFEPIDLPERVGKIFAGAI